MQTQSKNLDYLHSKKKLEKIDPLHHPMENSNFEERLEQIEISIKNNPSGDVQINKLPNENLKKMNFQRFSNFFYAFLHIKKSTHVLKLILEKFLLPHLIASIIVFFLIAFELKFDLNGKNKSISSLIYTVSRNVIFNVFYFIIMIHYCMFPFFYTGLGKVKKMIFQIIYFAFLLIIAFVYETLRFQQLYLLENDYAGPSLLYLIIFLAVLFLFLVFHFALKKQLKEKRKTLMFFLFVFVFFFLNYFIIKRYVIYEMYVSFRNVENWKIIFQIILFVYFQIYGKIFFSIITTIYHQEIEDEKNEDRFLFMFKYYACDLICSFLVVPLIRNEKLEFLLFGIFNFSVQLISIYYKQNYLFYYLIKFYNYVFQKKMADKTENESHEDRIKSIVAGSVKDIMFICVSTVFIVTVHNHYLYEVSWAALNGREILSMISYRLEILFLLFMISLMFFIYLIFKMKDKKMANISWKMERYNIILKIYYIVLLHGVIDNNIQFYTFLYALGLIK